MPIQGCQHSRDRRPFHSKSATFVIPGAFLDRFAFRLARIAWRPGSARGRRQLSKQFLCENRKSCYLREIVGSNRAPCEALGGEGKDEKRNFIWNRRNPLISPDSDE